MKLITGNEKISIAELKDMAAKGFGDLVKAVVDVERNILAIDADFLEFDSMINLRLSQNNRSRGVDDVNTQKKILAIISELVVK